MNVALIPNDKVHGTLAYGELCPDRYLAKCLVEHLQHLNPTPIWRREPWYNCSCKDNCVEWTPTTPQPVVYKETRTLAQSTIDVVEVATPNYELLNDKTN